MFYHCPTCFINVDLTTKSHRRGTVIEIANYNFYMKGIKTIYLHVYQDDIFACVCYSKSQPEHEILWLVTVNRSSGIAGRIFPYDSVFKLCFTIYTTRCVIKCSVDKSVFIKIESFTPLMQQDTMQYWSVRIQIESFTSLLIAIIR